MTQHFCEQMSMNADMFCFSWIVSPRTATSQVTEKTTTPKEATADAPDLDAMVEAVAAPFAASHSELLLLYSVLSVSRAPFVLILITSTTLLVNARALAPFLQQHLT